MKKSFAQIVGIPGILFLVTAMIVCFVSFTFFFWPAPAKIGHGDAFLVKVQENISLVELANGLGKAAPHLGYGDAFIKGRTMIGDSTNSVVLPTSVSVKILSNDEWRKDNNAVPVTLREAICAIQQNDMSAWVGKRVVFLGTYAVMLDGREYPAVYFSQTFGPLFQFRPPEMETNDFVMVKKD